MALPPKGGALLSISDRTKPDAIPVIRRLHEAGYRLYATEGTAADDPRARHAGGAGGEAAGRRPPQRPRRDRRRPGQLRDQHAGGRPPTTLQDGFQIRRAATERRIPCFTSIDTARAATDALLAGTQAFKVLPISEYRQPRA